MHDPSLPARLTASTPGKYFIFGHVEWDPTSATCTSLVDCERHLAIRLNGSRHLAMSSTAVYPNHIDLSVATYYELSAGDYVELTAFQDTAGCSTL